MGLQKIVTYRITGGVTSVMPTDTLARWAEPAIIQTRVQVPPMQSGWQRVSKTKVPSTISYITTRTFVGGKTGGPVPRGVATAPPAGARPISQAMAAALGRATQMRNYGNG